MNRVRRNRAEGCDCGCGASDVDCASSSVQECEDCSEGCSGSACPGKISPADNALVPSTLLPAGPATRMTRKAKAYDGALHPEEALSRKEAIRFYTANNAYLLFQEKETGSIEAGKLADLVVLDTDILKCPVDEIRNTRVLQTYVAGKLVFERR